MINSQTLFCTLVQGSFVLISDVDIEAMISCQTLETVNLEENPLSRECSDSLTNINNIRVTITPRELEEWEDLSI